MAFVRYQHFNNSVNTNLLSFNIIRVFNSENFNIIIWANQYTMSLTKLNSCNSNNYQKLNSLAIMSIISYQESINRNQVKQYTIGHTILNLYNSNKYLDFNSQVIMGIYSYQEFNIMNSANQYTMGHTILNQCNFNKYQEPNSSVIKSITNRQDFNNFVTNNLVSLSFVKQFDSYNFNIMNSTVNNLEQDLHIRSETVPKQRLKKTF